MKIDIKELRKRSGMSQKNFAEAYGIPVSTLRKWEQGTASPPAYVLDLIARSLPSTDPLLREVAGRDGRMYYYDKNRRCVMDSKGNSITVDEDLDGVKPNNLSLYIADLFADFYKAKEMFERDCRYDKKENINWI